MKLSEIVQFISGAETIPPVGCPVFQLNFKHDCLKSKSGMECACLPTANTCGGILTLPVHIITIEQMNEQFQLAIAHTKKFGFGLS